MGKFLPIASLICCFLTRSIFSQDSPNSLAVGEAKYCGVHNLNPFSDRIVGGIDCEPHEFPWLTKVTRLGNFHCGGSLISDRHVLSAGHCVSEWIEGASVDPVSKRKTGRNYEILPPNEFSVEFGAHKFSENREAVVRRDVKELFLHPDYDVFADREIMVQTNDIAIFKFEKVQFTRNIAPICLPARDSEVKDGAKLVVAGWGSTNKETIEAQKTALPDVAQKTEVLKIPFDTCRANKNVGWLLTAVNGLTSKEIFCGLGNNTDSCRGDSGGAAMLETNQGFVVAGVVSWGIGCNMDDYPAAYTRVSKMMDFIQANTKGGGFLPVFQPQG